jgi:hypothetical protein
MMISRSSQHEGNGPIVNNLQPHRTLPHLLESIPLSTFITTSIIGLISSLLVSFSSLFPFCSSPRIQITGQPSIIIVVVHPAPSQSRRHLWTANKWKVRKKFGLFGTV